MNAAAAKPVATPLPDVDAQDTPPAMRTYSLAYAIGAIFLAIEIPLLGLQAKYAFDGIYLAAFVLPPVLTAIVLLLVDQPGPTRTLPFRALVLFLVASLTSVVSTVLLTPFLVLSFRGGVTGNVAATGVVSAISLALVALPVVFQAVVAVRAGHWLHALLMAAGLAVTAVAFSMALAPTGALAASMRIDQGQLLMITSSWWLPVYAVAAALARRMGMA